MLHSLGIALFSVFLSCAVAVGTDPQPTVYLLIGPHKTGSTYLQDRIMKAEKELKDHNFYLPTRGRKAFSPFVHNLKEGIVMYSTVFTKALSAKQNIILASEMFSSVQAKELVLLARSLKGFRVHVVITYRDWLSIMHSMHEQLNRGTFHRTFPDFVMEGPRLEFDIRYLIELFGEVFGRQNLYVIDYNGMIAADRDLYEIFVKDVLGANFGNLGKTPKANISPPNLLPGQLYFIMAQYASSKYDCDYLSHPTFVATNRTGLPSLPIENLDLSKMVEYSRHIDHIFRRDYAGTVNMICADANATQMLHPPVIPQIVIDEVFHSAEWRHFFDSVIKERGETKNCNIGVN